MFKASLFMAAGIIDHETGTRDMRRINGMYKYMPRTAILGIVAAASMAGVPLMNGFLSKEMFFTETVSHPAFAGYTTWILPAFATLAGMLSVAYSARFVHDVFFNGEPIDLPKTPREPPRWMRLPVEVLVALVLFVGFMPQLAVGAILQSAASATIGAPMPPIKLAIWHGFNLPLAMSIVAFGLGVFYYWRRQNLYDLHDRFALKMSSPVAFERIYRDAGRASAWLLSAIDTRSLQRYLALFFGFAIGLGVWGWMQNGATTVPGIPSTIGPLTGSVPQTAPDAAALLALGALAAGALGTVAYHRHRLTAVMFMSVAGLMVSLTFVRFKAPDLALTQLSVEVVTIVLMLLALRFLPATAPPSHSS
ncbi:MAG: hydrogenase subunit MbhD domain-containing protein, partial [Hydrogenophaga sp.]